MVVLGRQIDADSCERRVRLCVVAPTIPSSCLDQPVITVEVETLALRYSTTTQRVSWQTRSPRPDVRLQIQAAESRDVALERLRIVSPAALCVTKWVNRLDWAWRPLLPSLFVNGVEVNGDSFRLDESMKGESEGERDPAEKIFQNTVRPVLGNAEGVELIPVNECA